MIGQAGEKRPGLKATSTMRLAQLSTSARPRLFEAWGGESTYTSSAQLSFPTVLCTRFKWNWLGLFMNSKHVANSAKGHSILSRCLPLGVGWRGK